MARRVSISLVVAAVLISLGPLALAADWPQYRYDAGRTAASTESLPASLHLQWVRELPTPRPAFPTEVRLRYDATYEPVVLGKTMFVPSMVTDSVTALDTEMGAERWQFFAEGPVRLAPVAWQGKVYFVSDDGYLYCVDSENGKLLWKFRGLPAGRDDRKVLGNERLVSLYPARGGPVLADGVVYFGAGIWCGEGVFVHALDAVSGQVIWSNTDSGQIEKANQDHGVGYYAGLSPQGHLALVDGKLVVPCGAQLPAILDPKTGKLDSYTMGWGGRDGLPKGCAFVSGIGQYLLHGGDLYDIRRPNDEQFRERRANDFKRVLYLGARTRLQIDRRNQKGLGQFREPVLTQDAMYFQEDGIVACDLTKPTIEQRATSEIPEHRENDKYPDKLRATFPELWKLASKSKVHIKAGDRLYCGSAGVVEAIDIPKGDAEPKITWQTEIQGTPHRMLAADGKLFVATREGRIYAFGGQERTEHVVYTKPTAPAPAADEWTKKAAEILAMTETTDGYVLVLGIGTGRLAEEFVRQSKCDVIAIDPDAERVASLRKQFEEAGLYGTRISILVGDSISCPLPPYLASLIVSENSGTPDNVFDQTVAKRLVRCLRPYGGTAYLPLPDDERSKFVAAVSGSKLPGITVREADGVAIVTREGRLPESADWSHHGATAAHTGASRDRAVKAPLARLWFDGSFRWIRTPGATVVRIAGGRIFLHSGNRLWAIDVYTGRHLWQVDLPLSRPSEDRMVAVEDAIYLASGKSCVLLDPATGERTGEISLPDDVGQWGSIRVTGEYLIGACGKSLVCLNRRNGDLIWKQQRQARIGCLALGGGKVYCADFARVQRNQEPPDVPVAAFDAGTGEVLWQVSGGWEIRYCEDGDLLCTPSGVFQGKDGSKLRDTPIALIAGDKLISGDSSQVRILDPRTGEQIGQDLKWFLRGCTRLRGGARVLTTRFMGNAAYLDIATGEITSIWNVRAACMNNLFPANGILNIPNLSGGCTCNYMPISQAFAPVLAFE